MDDALPKTITKTQFRRHLEEYIRKVEHGEELIIPDRGRPFCKVLPVAEDVEECFQGLRKTVLVVADSDSEKKKNITVFDQTPGQVYLYGDFRINK